MKLLHYLLGILSAFCLIFILLITSVEAVVYWTPGYFEKEYEKYQVLDHLPAMTMEDLLEVTDEMMDYLRGDREDLHITTTLDGQEREFFNEREIAHMEDVRDLFVQAIFLRKVCLGIIVLSVILKKPGFPGSFPPLSVSGQACSSAWRRCWQPLFPQILPGISLYSTTSFSITICGSWTPERIC